jgi:DNA-binding NarL/FixJ family response regulator
MTIRPDARDERVRTVALRIEDISLADHIAAMLADEVDLVVLDVEQDADVVITDHLPAAAQPPAILLTNPRGGLEALRTGAGGVLPRDCTVSDLVLAIEAAARGLAIIPRDAIGAREPEISAEAVSDEPTLAQGAPPLTPRELEVLQLLAEGASNKLIARRLGISIHTAKFHVASIAAKLDATGRTDAVAHAARLGLML